MHFNSSSACRWPTEWRTALWKVESYSECEVRCYIRNGTYPVLFCFVLLFSTLSFCLSVSACINLPSLPPSLTFLVGLKLLGSCKSIISASQIHRTTDTCYLSLVLGVWGISFCLKLCKESFLCLIPLIPFSLARVWGCVVRVLLQMNILVIWGLRNGAKPRNLLGVGWGLSPHPTPNELGWGGWDCDGTDWGRYGAFTKGTMRQWWQWVTLVFSDTDWRRGLECGWFLVD